VAQLYPWALGSLYVVSYDSQGYGGGTLTLPLPGNAFLRCDVLYMSEMFGIQVTNHFGYENIVNGGVLIICATLFDIQVMNHFHYCTVFF
jgi:hypothetical protein